MSLLDEFRRWTHPYSAEDDEDEEEEEEEIVEGEEIPREYEEVRRTPFENRRPQEDRRNKVVNVHAAPQLKVVLVRPERFENASTIADQLREKRTVVLNLETTDPEVSRRLVDFLSGVAYGSDGKIKRIAANTYLITPYNVEIEGELMDELENSGLYT